MDGKLAVSYHSKPLHFLKTARIQYSDQAYRGTTSKIKRCLDQSPRLSSSRAPEASLVFHVLLRNEIDELQQNYNSRMSVKNSSIRDAQRVQRGPYRLAIRSSP